MEVTITATPDTILDLAGAVQVRLDRLRADAANTELSATTRRICAARADDLEQVADTIAIAYNTATGDRP